MSEKVKLQELLKKYAEEEKKQQARFEQEVALTVIDYEVSKGGIVTLYSIERGGYAIPVDEKVQKILQMLDEGKIVNLKAKVIHSKRRITEIVEYLEVPVEGLEVPEKNVVVGFLTIRKTFLVLKTDDKWYYIGSGTENFSKLYDMVRMGEITGPVILLYSQREEAPGSPVFTWLRGIYAVNIKPTSSEKVVAEERVKVSDITKKDEENLPDQIEA